MKIALSALMLVMFLFVASGAMAQDGHPFVYTSDSLSLVDGEPDGTYTSSGTPPVAYVTVAIAGVFTVTNSGSSTKTAQTQYQFVCYMGESVMEETDTLDTPPTTGNYGVYYQSLIPTGYVNYGGNNSISGDVDQWVGNDYLASGELGTSDAKTGDQMLFVLGITYVAVN